MVALVRFAILLLLFLVLFCTLSSCENHYKVLGVSRTASSKEIKRAYVRLALKWHPDKTDDPEAHKMMSKINEAYKILSDEDKRRRYDILEHDFNYVAPPSTDEHETIEDEPDNEVNTQQFLDVVVPDSNTIPYLVYFFHDFCIRCNDWTEVLEASQKDFETIGVKLVSINVIINSKAAHHCGIYIHEVPKIVLLVNGKSQRFKNYLSFENLKEFLYDHLPKDTVKSVTVDSIKSITSPKSRIYNNKPAVFLVSPRVHPSLNYKIVSFTYRQYLEFYFVSTSAEMYETNRPLIEQLNTTQDDKILRIYSDLVEPVTVLKDENLNRETTKAALERHKLLTLPRVNSCTILDALCPDGPNTKLCVLLLAEGDNQVIQKFRSLAANQWNGKKFNMGYIDRYQRSTLMNAVLPSLNNHSSGTKFACKDGSFPTKILILQRYDNSKMNFTWYHGCCGMEEDNSKLLKRIQQSDIHESSKMRQCYFAPEPVNTGKLALIEELFKIFFDLLSPYWEKILAFFFIPVPLLTMSYYFSTRAQNPPNEGNTAARTPRQHPPNEDSSAARTHQHYPPNEDGTSARTPQQHPPPNENSTAAGTPQQDPPNEDSSAARTRGLPDRSTPPTGAGSPPGVLDTNNKGEGGINGREDIGGLSTANTGINMSNITQMGGNNENNTHGSSDIEESRNAINIGGGSIVHVNTNDSREENDISGTRDGLTQRPGARTTARGGGGGSIVHFNTNDSGEENDISGTRDGLTQRPGARTTARGGVGPSDYSEFSD